MTKSEADEMLQKVVKADKVGDDEMAHCFEDALHLAVIQHHAQLGCEISKRALETTRMKFARWCA